MIVQNPPKSTRKVASSAPSDVEKRVVASRWTLRLAAAGWTPVSNVFLNHYHKLKVTHSEAMVIIHLLSHKWGAKAPFPALKTIGKRMGISAGAVRNHLRNLGTKGFVSRQSRVGTTNRFYFDGLFQALETLLTQLEAEKAKVAELEAAMNEEEEEAPYL
jgi:DNA-binding MarR family transcriptional regulator